MANNALPDRELLDVLDAADRCNGNQTRAAQALGLNRNTFVARLTQARAKVAAGDLKWTPGARGDANPNDIATLRHQLRQAEKRLIDLEKEKLDEAHIKRHILKLTQEVSDLEPPAWLIQAKPGSESHGVPTLFLSDLHWGEKVEPSQINGVNRYNVKIAHQRLAAAAEGAVRLLSIISPKLDFPGIVIPLGGDMISGNIHDELTATNELNSMDSVLDLFSNLVGLIGGMAGKFGKVFLPCVTGNHGRDTHKIWNKDRHRTSFDWLLYCFLAKHFEKDKRITFHIPDGPDAYFRIFNHRYLLTHGDQFRGGDGMIGALGPVIRGDHKKRSRNAQISLEYDTLLLGHWHQYTHLTRLIINSSLKGMDEYAYNNNFPFEAPSQALWLTHPSRGITFRMPVFVDGDPVKKESKWVSLAA